MKNLSISTAAEKNKLSSNKAFLILLKVEIVNVIGFTVSTMYYARNDEDVSYDGNLYQKGSFDISGSSEAGAVSTVTLTVVDYTNSLQALMQANDGGVNSRVSIMVINAADLDMQPHPRPENVEYFDIIGASSAKYQVTWELGAPNVLAMRFPARIQRADQCSWKYKSTDCGYSGGITTCDLTLNGPNGCASHDNGFRYGAYPGLARS